MKRLVLFLLALGGLAVLAYKGVWKLAQLALVVSPAIGFFWITWHVNTSGWRAASYWGLIPLVFLAGWAAWAKFLEDLDYTVLAGRVSILEQKAKGKTVDAEVTSRNYR